VTIFAGGAPLNIAHGIREFAQGQPTAPAVIDGDRTLTYAQLDERANRVANVLLATGLPTGTPVALLLGNRAEYMEIAAGIARAGMVMVPLNPRMTVPEVEYIVGHAEAKALILDDAVSAIAESAAATLGTVLSLDGTTLGNDYEAALAAASTANPGIVVPENDPFCIAYTSGTTGRPKGVLISHRSRSLSFYACAMEWNVGVGRRSIAVAPMYHGAGFCFGYAPVHTGGTVSMLRSWNPEALLQMIERDKAQSVFLVPTHAQMLRALGDDVIAKYDLSSLDTFFFNAAALPVTLKEWVMATFPNVGVHELYGSTEGGIITNLRPSHATSKPGSVGTAWFAQELRVVDDEGNPVPPGEPGELFSRSPYLMNGYLKDPEATAACTTDDGFLTCGDIVIADEEGFIRIVDRKKDMIISGGVNVYPRDVEEALVTHPAIAEAAVIGVPDEKWGETVVAYVTLRGEETVDLETVDAHLRPMLAGYKIPREVRVIDSLPRNAGGKILKRELRDQHATPA
jgi:acyl-CoA synthetase (AMP-forming)/AMP-acid ligase II